MASNIKEMHLLIRNPRGLPARGDGEPYGFAFRNIARLSMPRENVIQIDTDKEGSAFLSEFDRGRFWETPYERNRRSFRFHCDDLRATALVFYEDGKVAHPNTIEFFRQGYQREVAG